MRFQGTKYFMCRNVQQQERRRSACGGIKKQGKFQYSTYIDN